MRSEILLLGLAYIIAALSACSGGGSASNGDGAPAVPLNKDTSTSTTNTTNTATAAYGVLGTSTARIAFVPSPGGVTPLLLENIGTKTVSWGAGIEIPGIPPTVPFTFPVSACTVDSKALKGVCIGFDSRQIGVMDLSKFITSLQISDIGRDEFDSGVGSVATKFSGTSCLLCGVAADVGRQRFVISGTGGFRVFNYDSKTAAAVYDIPIGENFAFLPQGTGASYIIAPEYEPKGGNRKLRVVNMDTGITYVWDKNTDSPADLGPAGSAFEKSEVDAAAVDINTKMIVLSNEDNGDFMLVDLNQAVFDNTALTFSAPFAFAKPNPATTVARLTDIAISTAGNILLSHGESASNIGVTQLPITLGTDGSGIGSLGVLDLNDPVLDRTPCGASYAFVGKGDPHGLSLYTGLNDSQRGLVIDASNSCAAVLDLMGLRNAPHSPTDPNSIDTSSAAVRSMVRFIKLK